jgi:hypothetical protein
MIIWKKRLKRRSGKLEIAGIRKKVRSWRRRDKEKKIRTRKRKRGKNKNISLKGPEKRRHAGAKGRG